MRSKSRMDEGFTAFVLASLDGAHGLAFMTNSANGMRSFPEIERTVPTRASGSRRNRVASPAVTN
jgi:hypothetical protein